MVLELGAHSDEGGRLARKGRLGCWCREAGVWPGAVQLATERCAGCMEGKKRRPRVSVCPGRLGGCLAFTERRSRGVRWVMSSVYARWVGGSRTSLKGGSVLRLPAPLPGKLLFQRLAYRVHCLRSALCSDTCSSELVLSSH